MPPRWKSKAKASICLSDNPLEADIQEQWLDMLKWNQVFHWRYDVTGKPRFIPGGGIKLVHNELAGFPDTCGLSKKGRFWAAEIKRKGENPTTLQKNWLAGFENNNGLTAVLRNYADMVAFLKVILDN